MHERRGDLDDDSRVASWTRGEKKRAMKATEAHERSMIFHAMLKRVMTTIGSVIAFWLVVKQFAGQSWSDLIALLGGRLPK